MREMVAIKNTFCNLGKSLWGPDELTFVSNSLYLYNKDVYYYVVWQMVGMKLLVKIFLSCMSGVLVSVSLAQDWGVYDQNTQPIEIVDAIVQKENQSTKIITTKLDQVQQDQSFGAENKISGTLESVRKNLANYLEWFVFIGMTAAVVLIIYNGILLVMNPVSWDDLKKIQKKLLYIIVGVLMMTGFYFILKVLLNIFTTVVTG